MAVVFPVLSLLRLTNLYDRVTVDQIDWREEKKTQQKKTNEDSFMIRVNFHKKKTFLEK